jgi:hypothetical protein
MGPDRYLKILAGVAIMLLIFHDLFHTIVLSRPYIHRPLLVGRTLGKRLWAGWRWVGSRRRRPEKRESFLATYGPMVLLIMLGVWGFSLTLGYALVIDGLRDQISPPPRGFLTSLYFSATTLLPVAYGDIVPTGWAARLAILAESATGVVLVALVITLLFSLYQSFQRREVLVMRLDAMAGAPPSGLRILETAAAHPLPERRLNQTFDDWQQWTAAVLESHLAYPILFYFRSSHRNQAWLNSFGAVMDAATLVLSTIEHDSAGAAWLTSEAGNLLVEDVTWHFGIKSTAEVGVERQEFDEAWARLREAGYRCRDAETAWTEFVDLRRRYASPLNRLAHWLAIVPPRWIGHPGFLPRRSP